MSALELLGVSRTRGNGRHATVAIRDVWLEVAAHDFVLLVGPSGAGKTTLLSVAAGLLAADSGEVVLAGRRLAELSPAALRRHRAETVGLVFQRANLLPQLSARDNVLLMATLAGVPRRPAEAEADALFDELGIAHLGARRPAELSGGEEQRVAVARALVHRPRVVLADEPTASLDGALGQAVAERLRVLAAERGAAVLAATHDRRLERYASRRVEIVDGRLANGR